MTCAACHDTGVVNEVGSCNVPGCVRRAERRRFRKAVRKTTTSPEGHHVQSLGVRVGYWPCLKAPFVQVAFANRTLDLWFGTAARKVQEECVV